MGLSQGGQFLPRGKCPFYPGTANKSVSSPGSQIFPHHSTFFHHWFSMTYRTVSLSTT